MELSAGIELAIGEMNSHFRRLDTEARESHVTLVNPVKELTGGVNVIADLGGPNDSYVWEVRRITLAGIPGAALPTLGTSLYICKGSSVALGNQFVVDTAPTLPSTATYGSGELIIRSPHNLIVVWNGGTGTLLIDVEAAERPKVTKLVSVI